MPDARDAEWVRAIYQLIGSIPPGVVATYGMLAALSGAPTWPRKAAKVVSRAPQGLPCHRVVHSDGSLAPEGIFPTQRAQLIAEGVTFTPSGRVNLRAHLWTPAQPTRGDEVNGGE